MLGNGSNDILELVDAGVPAAGRPAPSIRSTRSPSIRSPRRRAARIGIEVPARDLGHDLDAMRARDHADDARSCSSPTRTIPTGTLLPPAALEAFIASVPEDTLVVLDEAYNEYLPPEQQRAQRRVGAKYPEPGRVADVLQGLRARRRCASATAIMHAAGRRHAEPRAPAVQRQLAGAGGGGGGARRRRVRRREPRAQRRRHARSSTTALGALRPGLRAVARQLRAGKVGDARRASTSALLRAGRHRAAGRQLRRCRSSCA